MNQQFGNQFDRIHQNSLYNGAEQSNNFGQMNQIHQRTVSGNSWNPLSAGFGGAQQSFQQGYNQGVQNQFGGSQQRGGQQVQRIHQATMQNGMMAQPQISNRSGAGFGGASMMMGGHGAQQGYNAQQGFGGQQGYTAAQQGYGAQQSYNQGFQNQVSQNQLDRIQQNSLYNGGEQSGNWNQVNQIQQRTFSGNESNPLSAGYGAGASMMMGGQQSFSNQQGFGGQQGYAQQGIGQQGFGQQVFGAQQGYNQAYNQGFQNQVSQNQVDRIHQNSLYNGAEQSGNYAQANQIHQRTISGEESNMLQAGVGGGYGGYGGGFGGASMMSGAGFYNQGFGNLHSFSADGSFQNQVSQNQLDRIQQNSLYNGAEQSPGFSQEQRIHQASMQNGMFAQPQVSSSQWGAGAYGGQSYAQNFGGSQGQMGMGGGAFRAVMSADAGMTDDAGPSSYPASMYAGQNQYDTVNQSVFNQVNR